MSWRLNELSEGRRPEMSSSLGALGGSGLVTPRDFTESPGLAMIAIFGNGFPPGSPDAPAFRAATGVAPEDAAVLPEGAGERSALSTKARMLPDSQASAQSAKRTRRPSLLPLTRPARSSACRWRVVHDCERPTEIASSPTQLSDSAIALTSRYRDGTARQARTSCVRDGLSLLESIAQSCISHHVIDRNDLPLLAFLLRTFPMTNEPSASPKCREAGSFYGLTRERLAQRLAESGVPAYRATQVFSWVYRRHENDPGEMRNLPLGLREALPGLVDLRLPPIVSHSASADGGTHKFALELGDGRRVECVSMRAEHGLTFCLSSQVGCALRCPYCATGLMGLQRNLQSGEIVAQVLVMGSFHRWEDEGFNLVFMGMGEPLANYAAVLEAIRILHDGQGLNVGARRITVSTAGLVPQIQRLAGEDLALGLALSLHATTDELRDTLVPVNRRWPLAELLPAAQAYGLRTGRRVSLEYTLLAGVNDSADDADRLAAIARDMPSKINLIPYNPVPGSPYHRPDPAVVQAFAERLYPRAPAVTIRRTQGGEIGAACGQLAGQGIDAPDARGEHA
jgi:23S rRNA (adenine2503-C2)-methyltransferase